MTTEPMPIDEVTQADRDTIFEWLMLQTDEKYREQIRGNVDRGEYDAMPMMGLATFIRLTALADAERKLEEARQLLRPFAEAADDLDERHRDSSDIWEATAGMSITAGDLRDAARFLATQDREEV